MILFFNVDNCMRCTHAEMDQEFLSNGCASFGAKPVLGLIPNSSRSLEERALMSPFPSSTAFLFLPLPSHWSASSQAEVQPQPILNIAVHPFEEKIIVGTLQLSFASPLCLHGMI